MAYYVAPNTVTNGVYSGRCYVLDSSGGFSVEQGFSEILLKANVPMSQYDVTDALQLTYSVRQFNNKIGIIKDEQNLHVLHSEFNPHTELLPINAINISTAEFLETVNASSVISMGALSTLYSDFNNTVLTYFGAPVGFSTLFAGANTYNINGGVFDPSALVHIINGNSFDVVGSYVTDLSGSFTVQDINKNLKFFSTSNIFGNRSSTVTNGNPNDPDGCECEPHVINTGIQNGFIAGDLIFIPGGLTITLTVNIEAETILPINNIGPTNLQHINNRINFQNTVRNVSKTTTATLTNITQTYSVPILLVLSDIDHFNFCYFGKNWIEVSSHKYGHSIPWISISISANGQYQSAIDETGKIYISFDFGINWEIAYTIGEAISNGIAVSSTGQYQTASNGHKIYVSNDYGNTWNITSNIGSSNIFVAISLNGQYQTVVSCGDSVYTSSNFGLTWKRLSDESELYYSIEGFPTAGIAISYTGKIQVIVSENIYISNDFAQTWTNVSPQNGLDDRNWEGIAISSDGRYMTAIDSGGDIYRSKNGGNIWEVVPNEYNLVLIDKEWQAVSMSANGRYQAVLEKEGHVYISTNFGECWEMVMNPLVQTKNWQCLAISSNAQYMSIADYNGCIYVSQLI